MKVLALVGTRKGGFFAVGSNPRDSRQVDGPQLEGGGVFPIDTIVSGG